MAVKLAGSGISTSRLGFGTSRLHQVDQRRRALLLEMAVDLGITHIDTAPSYGDGLAEEEIGRVLRPHRARIVIATKYGIAPNPLKLRAATPALAVSLKYARVIAYRLGVRRSRRPRITADGLRRSVEQSLQRMRTDWLDILLLHEPSRDTIDRPDDVLGKLDQLKAEGLIRGYGLAGAWHDINNLVEFAELGDLVIQTKEDEWPDSDPPDISYGAISAGLRRPTNAGLASMSAVQRLQVALDRRQNGTTLFSTLNPEHLREIAVAVNGDNTPL